MKKLLFLFLLIFAFSCENSLYEPECKCGEIVEFGYSQTANNSDGCLFLDIENNCTGHVKRFCFQDVERWSDYSVGDTHCDAVSSW